MTRRVAVLGCGPTGLVAAHAFAIHGWEVTVLSKKRKSEMYGAQYLHKPIPGASNRAPVQVKYALRGTVDGYRSKVYGLSDDIDVSPQTLDDEHWAWDIRDTYNVLWEMYSDSVRDVQIDQATLRRLHASTDFDMVVSSVPTWPVLCTQGDKHTFRNESIWAAGEAPERGVFLPRDHKAERNTILCSGDPADRWYRISTVFGVSTAEWPLRGNDVPLGAASMVIKPISTDCDCYPRIVRIGRYGEWKKGVLVHEAFHKAIDLVLDAA